MASPGCSSVSVKWQQFNPTAPPPVQAPTQLHALFNNCHTLVYGFVPHCTQATLLGDLSGQEIKTMVSTSELQKTRGTFLHELTARAIIRDYEDGSLDTNEAEHEGKKAELKSFVIELSKEFSILSQFTSFVAIEERDSEQTEEGFTDIPKLIAEEDVDLLPYMSWSSSQDEADYEELPCGWDSGIPVRSGSGSGYIRVSLQTSIATSYDWRTDIDKMLNSLSDDETKESPSVVPSEPELVCDALGVSMQRSVSAEPVCGSAVDLSGKKRELSKMKFSASPADYNKSLFICACPAPPLPPPPPPLTPSSSMYAIQDVVGFAYSPPPSPPSLSRSALRLVSEDRERAPSSPLPPPPKSQAASLPPPPPRPIGSFPDEHSLRKAPWLSSASAFRPPSLPMSLGAPLPPPPPPHIRPLSAKRSLPEALACSALSVPPPPPPKIQSAPLTHLPPEFTNLCRDIPAEVPAKDKMYNVTLSPSQASARAAGRRAAAMRYAAYVGAQTVVNRVKSADDPCEAPLGALEKEIMSFDSLAEDSTVPFHSVTTDAASLGVTRAAQCMKNVPFKKSKHSFSLSRTQSTPFTAPQTPLQYQGSLLGSASHSRSSDAFHMPSVNARHLTHSPMGAPYHIHEGFSFGSTSVIKETSSPLVMPDASPQENVKRLSGVPFGQVASQPQASSSKARLASFILSEPPMVGHHVLGKMTAVDSAEKHSDEEVQFLGRRRGGALKLALEAKRLPPSTVPQSVVTISVIPEEMKLKWVKIFQMQHSEGYWECTAELGEFIKVDVDAFANVFLKNKGISSLGVRAHKDILRLVATLLVLQLMRIEKLEEGKLLRTLFCLDDSPQPRSERWKAVKRAVDWACWADREYPCVYSRLEFGWSWESATRQLLGYERLPSSSPLSGFGTGTPLQVH